ncbi:hypothetical protein EBZ37_08525, partial [bacterium]|nr:hypothetical protein [bacterium]
MSSKSKPSSIRSVRSTGVAGLLSPKGKVFHEIFYDAGGLGRASDLVAARFRGSSPDELSLHLIVLFGALGTTRVFEAISPIRFECGMDESFFAFSFSFELTEIPASGWDGISERIQAGVVNSALDELLLSIAKRCDYVVLKCITSENRIEICTMSSWGRRAGSKKAPVEVELIADSLESSPEVLEYTALGDLDYSNLLKVLGQDDAASVTGEVLVHQAKSAEELLVKLKSKNLLLQDSTVIRVSADTQMKPEEEAFEASSSFESDLVPDPSLDSLDAPEKLEQKSKSKIMSWFSGWFRPEPQPEPKPAPDVPSSAAVSQNKKETESPSDTPSTDAHRVVRDMEKAFSEGAFGRLMNEVGADGSGGRTERIAEGLLAELNAERSRLIDLSKALSNSFRVKELEFKNRENALAQNAREKEDALRAKTLQLMRMKDQVAKLQILLERAKFNSTSSDESGFKYKYAQSQKLLQTARSEAETLRSRVEELQTKLFQAADQRKQSVPIAVHNELERQVEKQAR